MKKIASLLLAVLLVCLMIPFAAIGAAAEDTTVTKAYDYPGNEDPPEGYYFIRNVGNNGYLGIKKTSKGELRANIQGTGDLFYIKKIQLSNDKGRENAYAYQIRIADSPVAQSGYSLRVMGIEGWPTNGTEVAAEYEYNLWHQRWAFEKAGNGQVYIRTYLDNDATPNKGANGVHPYLDIKWNDYANNDNCACVNEKFNTNSQLWVLELSGPVPEKIKGTGLAKDPFIISTSKELAKIAELVNAGSTYRGVHFKLANGLIYDGPQIGSENHPFCGTFDGDSHTIKVNINSDKTYSGLFGTTNGATIKNLAVTGTVSGKNCLGAIVGYAYGNTRIDNCYVNATVSGTAENVGGIIGMMADSTVSNCRVDATVSGAITSTGGIIGGILSGGKIINCIKTGDTIGVKAVGGIFGCVLAGDPIVANCASIGKVTSIANNHDAIMCGGIIGLISKDVHSATLYSCYVNCDVKAKYEHGYICGRNENSTSEKLDASTYKIEAKRLYYVELDRKAFNNFGTNSPFCTEVAYDQIPNLGKNAHFTLMANAFKALNDYAEDDGKTQFGIPLTKWTDDGNNILPGSCQTFIDDSDTVISSSDGSSQVDGTSSIISAGNIWIIAAVAAAVICAALIFVIVNNKKKK